MFASVNGFRMYCELHGKPAGVPLLFVHGFPLSGEMWRACIEPLEKEYRIIVPDLRGFGRSESGPKLEPGVAPVMSMTQYADDLANLLEEIRENRPLIVIGHSMGGYIVFEFYRRFAERVFAMALVNTRAGADSAERIKEREDTAAAVLRNGSEAIANGMVEKLFSPRSPHEMRERWRKLMSATPREGAAAALLAMAKRADSTAALAAISCPAMIVVGEHDGITPPSEARSMHQAITASELVVVPHAGHMTPVEQPGAFITALTKFLGKHVPPGPWGTPNHD